MATGTEVSSDNTCEISYNTTTIEVTIKDLVEGGEGTWECPMDQEGVDEISENIVPGFKNGQIMIMIGRIIKRVLT